MSDRAHLGDFEQIVMIALLRLGEEAYGMRVRQEIEQRTGRETSIGAVYATLDRLEGKGFVKSSLGKPTRERGGRAKRTFILTAKGSKALESSHDALMRMIDGLQFGGLQWKM